MFNNTKLKLSLLFVFLCFGYLRTLSMDSTNNESVLKTQYDVGNDLQKKEEFQDFCYFDFESEDVLKKPATGVYQFIPYLQKVFVPRNDNETSRFIIQKHPFNGEWQLTEIYHSIHRRTIHSFTNKSENENAVQGKTITEVFNALNQNVQEQEITIKNLKEEVKAKNESIETLLTTQNESSSSCDTNTDLLKEITKNTEIYEQLQEKLFEKENEILELNTKFEEKLFEKENEILKVNKKLETTLFEKHNDILELNTKFEEKLFEKEKKIFEVNKKLETKLFEKEKQIVDLRAQFEKQNIDVKNEQNKMHKEKINLIKNKMNLEKSKLENRFWEEQETLKENLSSEKFNQKETQINVLQKQFSESQSENNKFKMTQKLLEKEKMELEIYNENFSLQLTHEKKRFSECESEINKLKMTQEILEKEKENLINYNQNVSTQLKQEKKKFKEMESAMKTEAKTKQSEKKTQLEKGKNFKNKIMNIKDPKVEYFLNHPNIIEQNSEIQNQTLNVNNAKQNAELNFEKGYQSIIIYFDNENKKTGENVLKKLHKYYEDSKYSEEKIQKMKAVVKMNTNTFVENPDFQYEITFLHHGVAVFAQGELIHAEDRDKIFDTNENMKYFWNNGGKLFWNNVLQKIHDKHTKCRDHSLKSVKYEPLKEQAKFFLNNPDLMLDEQYQYETMLMNVGIGLHGGKKTLEEFQNISQSFISETKTQCKPNVPNPTEIQNVKVFDSSLTKCFITSQAMITNKMNENNMKEIHIKTDLGEEYQNMVTILHNDNKLNENLFQDRLKEYFEKIKSSEEKIKKIQSLVELNTNTLEETPGNIYEIILIHYGAEIYAHTEIDRVENKLDSANLKMKNWWHNDGGKWIYIEVVTKIYLNHQKYSDDGFKSMKDTKLKKRFGCLMKEAKLFQKTEYQYEYILILIGMAMHARKEVLEEFKNIKTNN